MRALLGVLRSVCLGIGSGTPVSNLTPQKTIPNFANRVTGSDATQHNTTLWKIPCFFIFSGKVWKRLETSGFGMIFNFLFWKSLEFCPKVKNFNFNFKKKLFPQLFLCCFTYCLDLYSLFLSFNDNF